MNTQVILLTYWDLAIAASLLLFNAALSIWFRLGLENASSSPPFTPLFN